MKKLKKDINSSKKLFLIEDDPTIIDIYSLAFNQAGIDFDVLTSGAKALEKIKNIQEGLEEKPSLILLDLMLPDINGLELLLKIRENDATKNIKVFIVSNYTSEALLNIKYIKPDKFIVKTSITPSELVDLVKENL